MKSTTSLPSIAKMIVFVRGCKIILASDLASIYEVPTKVFNQAVKRNAERFPSDFMFRLTKAEAEEIYRSRSQNVTLNRGMNIKYLPYAFTEHGAIMAASIINSPRAIQMSVLVVRVFVRMRRMLACDRELAIKLKELETQLKNRLDVHESAIVNILQRIMKLIDPPTRQTPPRRPMGF